MILFPKDKNMGLLNFIFPQKCVLCGEMIGKSSGVPFCDICYSKYLMLKKEKCPVCRKEEAFCRCRADTLRTFGQKVSERHIFGFDSGISKKLIYTFKRSNNRALQNFFARECADIIENEIDGKKDGDYVLAYPPRSVSGKRKYGFDQAYVLSKKISGITGIPLEKLFKRKLFGEEQKNLSAKERMENAANVFYAAKNANVKGKSVIIIDDVVTSGSTVWALCNILCELGAEKIYIVSPAKVR